MEVFVERLLAPFSDSRWPIVIVSLPRKTPVSVPLGFLSVWSLVSVWSPISIRPPISVWVPLPLDVSLSVPPCAISRSVWAAVGAALSAATGSRSGTSGIARPVPFPSLLFLHALRDHSLLMIQLRKELCNNTKPLTSKLFSVSRFAGLPTLIQHTFRHWYRFPGCIHLRLLDTMAWSLC